MEHGYSITYLSQRCQHASNVRHFNSQSRQCRSPQIPWPLIRHQRYSWHRTSTMPLRLNSNFIVISCFWLWFSDHLGFRIEMTALRASTQLAFSATLRSSGFTDCVCTNLPRSFQAMSMAVTSSVLACHGMQLQALCSVYVYSYAADVLRIRFSPPPG